MWERHLSQRHIYTLFLFFIFLFLLWKHSIYNIQHVFTESTLFFLCMWLWNWPIVVFDVIFVSFISYLLSFIPFSFWHGRVSNVGYSHWNMRIVNSHILKSSSILFHFFFVDRLFWCSFFFSMYQNLISIGLCPDAKVPNLKFTHIEIKAGVKK